MAACGQRRNRSISVAATAALIQASDPGSGLSDEEEDYRAHNTCSSGRSSSEEEISTDEEINENTENEVTGKDGTRWRKFTLCQFLARVPISKPLIRRINIIEKKCPQCSEVPEYERMCESQPYKLCNGYYSDLRPINRGFLYPCNVFRSLLCPRVTGQTVATEKAYAGSRGERTQSDLYGEILWNEGLFRRAPILKFQPTIGQIQQQILS